MAGADDPDFALTITSRDGPARYRLTFGSLLRGGALYEHPDLDRAINGRFDGGVATIEPDETHSWAADGPITFYNNGRSAIEVRFDNRDGPLVVPPQGSIDAACPTEKKRIVALGAVGGGLAALASGYITQ